MNSEKLIFVCTFFSKENLATFLKMKTQIFLAMKNNRKVKFISTFKIKITYSRALTCKKQKIQIMKIFELHARANKIMKIIEFNARIMKIIKILEF